jgi:hypothetical protein
MKTIHANSVLRNSVYAMNGVVSKVFLRRLLNCIDVVVDQFLLGWYGSSFVEAAASSRMTLIHLDKAKWHKYMDTEFPPVRDCSNMDKIQKSLEDLVKGDADFRHEGEELNRWASENHGMQNLVPRFLKLAEQHLQV